MTVFCWKWEKRWLAILAVSQCCVVFFDLCKIWHMQHRPMLSLYASVQVVSIVSMDLKIVQMTQPWSIDLYIIAHAGSVFFQICKVLHVKAGPYNCTSLSRGSVRTWQGDLSTNSNYSTLGSYLNRSSSHTIMCIHIIILIEQLSEGPEIVQMTELFRWLVSLLHAGSTSPGSWWSWDQRESLPGHSYVCWGSYSLVLFTLSTHSHLNNGVFSKK